MHQKVAYQAVTTGIANTTIPAMNPPMNIPAVVAALLEGPFVSLSLGSGVLFAVVGPPLGIPAVVAAVFEGLIVPFCVGSAGTGVLLATVTVLE